MAFFAAYFSVFSVCSYDAVADRPDARHENNPKEKHGGTLTQTLIPQTINNRVSGHMPCRRPPVSRRSEDIPA